MAAGRAAARRRGCRAPRGTEPADRAAERPCRRLRVRGHGRRDRRMRWGGCFDHRGRTCPCGRPGGPPYAPRRRRSPRRRDRARRRMRGARRPALAEVAATRGRVSASAFRAALPTVGDLAVLSWDRDDATHVDSETMRAMVRAGQRGSELVVIDLPRRLDETATEAALMCGVLLVVTTTEVRAVASTQAMLGGLRRLCIDIRLAVRELSGADLTCATVAETLGCPWPAKVPTQRSIVRAVDEGLGPLGAWPARAGLPRPAQRPRRTSGREPMTSGHRRAPRPDPSPSHRTRSRPDARTSRRRASSHGQLVGDEAVLDVVDALRLDSTGAGPLEALLHRPGVTDVLVNGPDEVYLDVGHGLQLTDVRFADDAAVRRLAQRLASTARSPARRCVAVRRCPAARRHSLPCRALAGGEPRYLSVAESAGQAGLSMADLVDGRLAEPGRSRPVA